MTAMNLSLQEQWMPDGTCFGCGPANGHGLRLRSFPSDKDGGVIAEWRPEAHHNAYPGFVCGGVIGNAPRLSHRRGPRVGAERSRWNIQQDSASTPVRNGAMGNSAISCKTLATSAH
jgi:hypothetical protein